MSQLPSELTALAYQCIFQRTDGAGFASTSNDRPQWIGGTLFEPISDLRPSDLIIHEDLFSSSFTLTGGIDAFGTSLSQSEYARWQGASVELLAGDWEQASEPAFICRGALGPINVEDGRFSASVNLIPVAAYRPPCVQTSSGCRATLGDERCGVDMRSRHRRIEVIGAEDNRVELGDDNYESFRDGRLRWVSGANCGSENTIIDVDGTTLHLLNRMASPCQAGDRAIVFEGCDGDRETCGQRFGNIVNFRGEPDLPGSSILMRFPGA